MSENDKNLQEVNQEEKIVEQQPVAQESQPDALVKVSKQAKDKNKVKESKQANKKQQKKKEKKQNVLVKKVKEVLSELKKVSWPSFGKVVKQTGVVIAVVIIFTVILFGIERLLAFLFELLMSSGA